MILYVRRILSFTSIESSNLLTLFLEISQLETLKIALSGVYNKVTEIPLA